jgi:hypothetical protein
MTHQLNDVWGNKGLGLMLDKKLSGEQGIQ